MQIIVNGETIEIPDQQRLSDVLETRQPRPPFAVEINKQLVRRTQYVETRLRDGDKIEIVTLVGGG
jgi:thiamine biosynthesis protein ThiS